MQERDDDFGLRELRKLDEALAKKTAAIDAASKEVRIDGAQWQKVSMPLTIGILVFGVIVLLLMTYLIKAGRKPLAVLRSFCVPMIIVGALVLVVAGYTKDQIAPVIGLLGTLAGYLLGRSDDPDVRRDDMTPQVAQAASGSADELP